MKTTLRILALAAIFAATSPTIIAKPSTAPPVPDGGASVVLVAGGIAGLAAARRFFKK